MYGILYMPRIAGWMSVMCARRMDSHHRQCLDWDYKSYYFHVLADRLVQDEEFN